MPGKLSMTTARASVFIATSLDGFIARADGNIDWLHEPEHALEGEDFGFKDFFDSIDTLIMGRKTMEMVLSFNEWPYEGKRVIVLSNSLRTIPKPLAGKIELSAGPVKELVTSLADQGCKRLYIDGGKTIQSFIKESLISDITITTIPILLGQGKPLFGETPKDIHLKHNATRTYPNGFVQSSYEIIDDWKSVFSTNINQPWVMSRINDAKLDGDD